MVVVIPLEETTDLGRKFKAIVNQIQREAVSDGNDVVEKLEPALSSFLLGLVAIKDTKYMEIYWSSDDQPQSCLEISVPGQSLNKPATIALPNELLCRIAPRLLSLAAAISTHVVRLEICNFGFLFDANAATTRPPVVEDIFQAFGNEGAWRNTLKYISVHCAHMNALGDSFDLSEGAYPERLETIDCCFPVGTVESATIYRVASRSPRLRRLCTGGGVFSATMELTQGALDALCDILSRSTSLGESLELPYEELNRLTEASFEKVVRAVARGHRSYHALSLVAPGDTPYTRLEQGRISWARTQTLHFHLLANHYIDFLDRQPISCASLALNACLRRFESCWPKEELLFTILLEVLPDLILQAIRH